MSKILIGMKTAAVVRHIHFEDLGTFEAVLEAADYRIHYYDLGLHDLWRLDPLQPDLLIVLGGPVGVYDTDAYSFLAEERAILKTRLKRTDPRWASVSERNRSPQVSAPM